MNQQHIHYLNKLNIMDTEITWNTKGMLLRKYLCEDSQSLLGWESPLLSMLTSCWGRNKEGI